MKKDYVYIHKKTGQIYIGTGQEALFFPGLFRFTGECELIYVFSPASMKEIGKL